MQHLSFINPERYEIWVEIFSHLSPVDVAISSTVCRFFYEISKTQVLWEELTRRNYPETHAYFSGKQIVQEERKNEAISSNAIDWKEECIERVLFFSAAKKDQLGHQPLFEGYVTCFDIFEDRVYIGAANKLVATADDEETRVERQSKKSAIIFSIKVEKREDGKIYVYTGDINGSIIIWQFDGFQFKKEKDISKYSTNRVKIFALDFLQENNLITADYHQVRIWNKVTGENLKTFSHNKKNDGFGALTVTQNKIVVGTMLGIIKIWDANTLQLLNKVHDIKELKLSIQHIRVRDQKVFYSNHKGLFVFDLTQRSNTQIVNGLQSVAFDISDKLFYFQEKEDFLQGINIIDLETLTVESEPFSPVNSYDTSIKAGPHGILYSDKEGLYLTDLGEEVNDDVSSTN